MTIASLVEVQYFLKVHCAIFLPAFKETETDFLIHGITVFIGV